MTTPTDPSAEMDERICPVCKEEVTFPHPIYSSFDEGCYEKKYGMPSAKVKHDLEIARLTEALRERDAEIAQLRKDYSDFKFWAVNK